MYRQAEYDRAGIKTVAGQLGLNAARWQILPLDDSPRFGELFACAPSVSWDLLFGFVHGCQYWVHWARRWGFVSDRPNRWARAIFLYSLLYMNLIVVFLVVDTQWDRVINLLG